MVRSADLQAAAHQFQRHCAMCHGESGRPDLGSAVVKSLGAVPADFTDQLFNSREPAGDFFMVIKYGGAALGLSEKMPAFGEQLSDAGIEALVAYVKTLAGEHDHPPGDLNLFLPLKTRKAFPEDEVVWKSAFTDNDDREEFKQTLEIEKRFGSRSQVMVELSHSFEDGDEHFSSVEFGAKHVLHDDLRLGFIATLAGVVEVPLDGEGSVEVLPYLAAAKILSEACTLQGSARAKLPVNEVEDGSVELSGIVHWVHTPWSRAVFPALEMTVELPLDRSGTRADVVQLSLTPQIRIGLTKGGHVALNLGAEVALNDTWRYDWRGHAFLIWDFADGPFWAGW